LASSSGSPAEFSHLTELSLDATGSFVLHATDDYFAPKESLLRPHAPEWHEGEYTERGKWMDGWESSRRRTPGHDWVIVRLGTPGTIEGVVCDTTHFKGNAPQEVSLEALDAPLTTPIEELLATPVDTGAADTAGGRTWREVIPRTAVKPDFPNVLIPFTVSGRATHVRLRIHPDGGVARLRVFGEVQPDADVFWGPGSVDLAAIENGGAIALASDSFFGPPSNLLLPGRSTNMGGGWETRRRRTPGSDWCVIRLGRRGRVHHLDLDTHFFKGNAPQAVLVEYLDAEGLPADAIASRLPDAAAWKTLVERSAVSQHRRHRLVPMRGVNASHLRVHIFPHGGVNRLRAFGEAADTPAEARALVTLHALEKGARNDVLMSFCPSRAFVERLASSLPVGSVRALVASAAAAMAALSPADLLEAYAAHPRLGAAPPASDSSAHAGWSRAEQSSLAAGAAAQLDRLRAGNDAYFAKFGFPFIAFASGRGAGELAELLEERLASGRDAEIERASLELARITRLRIGRWLAANGAG
jgi:allantoicase